MNSFSHGLICIDDGIGFMFHVIPIILGWFFEKWKKWKCFKLPFLKLHISLIFKKEKNLSN